MMRSGLMVAALAVLASCSGGGGGVATVTAEPDAGSATTAPAPRVTTSIAATESAAPPSVGTATTAAGSQPVVPSGFEQVAATVTMADGTPCELCLWLADTDDRRSRGLMFATELGGPDGMVFRYSSPTTSAFWMKNTVMPLSIAFFAADGSYLGAFDMEPCTADPCATYPTPADFVDAIEVPQGDLPVLGIEPGSTLVVHDLPCGGT